MWLASACLATILNAVLQQEYRRQIPSGIGFVHKHRSLLHKLLVILADDAYDRIEKWMARANKDRNRLLIDLPLPETDPLILGLDRRSQTDLAISLSNAQGNMRDLPSALLTLLQASTEMLECFNKKALDMVRLKPQSFGTFHLDAKLMNL